MAEKEIKIGFPETKMESILLYRWKIKTVYKQCVR